MNSYSGNPLAATLPTEVPLPYAPLVRVIVQIRFPSVLSIEKRDFVAPFQESIRDRYPILKSDQTRGVMLGPQGPSQMPPSIVWRFSDLDDHWRVSLAPEFLAIETTKYKSRSDLLDRFREVIRALDTHIGPKLVERLGVRFIDRITGNAVATIGNLVRPEVLGVAGTDVAKQASLVIGEAQFTLPDHAAQMRARWGLLPPDTTVDPAAIEPLKEKSWILDLDTFSSAPYSFDIERVFEDARTFAERSYSFFRWVVTDEFLRLYGGKP